MANIILASGSAIRQEQLKKAGIQFEAITSGADETPDMSKCPSDRIAEIALRKAEAVLLATKSMGRRLIIAADHNIMFENELHGKPKTIAAARQLLRRMRGSRAIYSYVGNAILLAEENRILQSINLTDIATLSIDSISDDILDSQASTFYAGGFQITKNDFVHLVSGRYSTAAGMTIEYITEILPLLSRE